jgi:hypothetical protein
MSTVCIVAALFASHLVNDFHALFGALFPAAKAGDGLLHSFFFKVIDQGLRRRRAEILGYLFDSLINLFGNGDGCLYEAHFSLLSPIIGLDGNTVKEYQLIIFCRKMSQVEWGQAQLINLWDFLITNQIFSQDFHTMKKASIHPKPLLF